MPVDPVKVKELFQAALSADDVGALLRDLDAETRRRVEELLAAHAKPGLTGPFVPEAPAGGKVGPYKLLQQIGEGGMGVVWMAEQSEPVRRRVAVKVIRPGMASAQVLARFEAERQALAMMDHPNIARVFDAGTTEGRPYFVMELVHGVPITRFCEERKLPVRRRLELFRSVCQAIQHAHMKGVIHRDIKPSNVLVCLYDDEPVPKVIDFGVAKALDQPLTERTLFTQFGAVVGTLEYMSPEQAVMNQLGIDTRSDVYSLGVLLYELLTGTTPLERGRLRTEAFDAVLRLIREEEPPRPSTRLSTMEGKPGKESARLAGEVRGELDWIAMKALEKDRARRYETASALARDVERHLAGEPVEACPPTLGYRLAKAYRRNRAAILIAGAFAAVMAAAAVVSVMFGLWARQAAALAEGRRIEAEESGRETTEANRKLRLAHDDLRNGSYLWDMQMMPAAWAAGNLGQMREALARHVPTPDSPDDLRRFEWHYWDRQCHAERALRQLEPSSGAAVTGGESWDFSGDGIRLASLKPPKPGGAPPGGDRVGRGQREEDPRPSNRPEASPWPHAGDGSLWRSAALPRRHPGRRSHGPHQATSGRGGGDGEGPARPRRHGDRQPALAPQPRRRQPRRRGPRR